MFNRKKQSWDSSPEQKISSCYKTIMSFKKICNKALKSFGFLLLFLYELFEMAKFCVKGHLMEGQKLSGFFKNIFMGVSK